MSKETLIDPLWIGTDFKYPCTIKNGAESACVDIAGWSLSFLVKRSLADLDANAVIAKTTSSGIVISGAFNQSPALNAQVAEVTISDDDTVNLTPGLLFYELKRTDPGFEVPLIYGRLNLRRAVHQQ